MEKKVLVENIKDGILEGFLTEESRAAKQAKSLGMRYVGFGRWSDGKLTYKSDGANLIPMDGAKDKPKSKDDFLQKFVKKCNDVAEQEKSGKSLLQTMISMLPGREKGEHFGKTEVLEKILNSAIPYFNKFVMNALKNKQFRVDLLKGYLGKFEKNIGEQDPLKDNPEVNQSKPQMQQQPKMQQKPQVQAVAKPNVAQVKPQ